jgi:hypothetical protein
MIEIESGIPIPVRGTFRGNSNSGRKAMYPFGDMAVGDSFFVPVKNGRTPAQTRNSITGAISYHTKAHPGRRFVSRIVEGGVRFWRTA